MTESQEWAVRPTLGFSFLDPEIQQCPYEAYAALRDHAPVYQDPKTGFFVVTRYEDVRAILLDPETFSSRATTIQRRKALNPDRYERVQRVYEWEGWVPGLSLSQRDDPEHKQARAIFDRAFRPGQIKALEPFIRETVNRLFDAFLDDGACEWVEQFAIPLPLTVISHIAGARQEDIPKIRGWMDSWIARLSMMQTEEEEIASVRQEIEAQHYFHAIFEQLRAAPNGTLLSDLVNSEVPEWGRRFTDNELLASMFADLFAAGFETTASALSSGMKLLIEHPEVWQKIKADPESYLRSFIEESLRLESPTQGLFRTTTREVTLHGVTIPAGAVINVRFAAANRDERHFACPDVIDLTRRNAATHLAFGAGTHHCLGAPLARRELYWAFRTLAERVDAMWFAPGMNEFEYQNSPLFRRLKALYIEFKKR